MTVAAIHQPQYLPYLGFFDKIARADVLVVLDDVQFHRRGLQHRNKIKTSTGWQWLTLPVTGGHDQAIRDVRLSDTEPWQRKHANAIRWNYGRAPYFPPYAEEMIEIIQHPWERMIDADMALLRWVMRALGLEPSIAYSSDLEVRGIRSERLANLCRTVGATTYLSGPGGRRYVEPDVFERAGVELAWQEFAAPRYEQLFPEHGFIPDLSVIDTLLCCGPETSSMVGATP